MGTHVKFLQAVNSEPYEVIQEMVGGKPVFGARATCCCCGAVKLDRNTLHMPPEMVTKKFVTAGWRFSNKGPLCPDCQSSGRVPITKQVPRDATLQAPHSIEEVFAKVFPKEELSPFSQMLERFIDEKCSLDASSLTTVRAFAEEFNVWGPALAGGFHISTTGKNAAKCIEAIEAMGLSPTRPGCATANRWPGEGPNPHACERRHP